MKNKIIFLTLRLAIILSYQCDCNNTSIQQGYYWRNFVGKPLDDALEAGLTAAGQPLFIGQTTHLNNVIVGKIAKNEYTLYYEFYGAQKTTKDIKILCTPNPNYFVWDETDINKVDFINEKYLVVGGHEPNRTLYIGRTFYNLEITLGKVVKTRGLYAVTSNELKFKSFEILTYQPLIQKGYGVTSKIDIYTD